MPIPTARLFLSAAIILAGTCAAASANEHVQIRVFNPARIRERDLLRAEREISRIFSAAGMDIRWAEGTLHGNASSLVDFSPDDWSPLGCKVASHAGELRVRLVPHVPDLAAPRALGYSLPCAAYGIDATIFIDNCEGLAQESNASRTPSRTDSGTSSCARENIRKPVSCARIGRKPHARRVVPDGARRHPARQRADR